MDDNVDMRVLIVEDHRMVAEAFTEIIEQQPDMEVVGYAATVDEARRLARSETPDVVLMDFRLRDGDGVQATLAIKEDRPETQVVMVTSALTDAVLIPALEAGCSGFLTKDRPIGEVLAAVRSAALGESTISPDMLVRLLPRLRPMRKGVAEDLTPRELEVLRLLAAGESTQSIANALVLSSKTVRNHVQSILAKLGVHSKLEAVSTAARRGLIRFDGVAD